MHTLDEDLAKSGDLDDEQGLTDASQAKSVGIKDGIPVATDCPFGIERITRGLLGRRR